MEKIQHSHVQVRGLKLHVAQIGTGPKVVLFLHGFPEIWYSWRHQMIAVANAGFRAIAFDSRGYGLSDHPPEPEKANFKDLVDDVVALLDLLGINKVTITSFFLFVCLLALQNICLFFILDTKFKAFLSLYLVLLVSNLISSPKASTY
ncbi:hypothetical protein Goari_021563 [Gossypium aridum]|uniref:AB hydrolase-1 domain-containing protein n=1 Tax=Gossypium aridum TaxID=34290 RepID=A0A7J8YG95_GOSAI|nr:hypothetical protein [Gossypium aridum]